MTYAELVDAAKASLDYDLWCKGRDILPTADGRAAYIAGYRRGFDAGYDQGWYANEPSE